MMGKDKGCVGAMKTAELGAAPGCQGVLQFPDVLLRPKTFSFFLSVQLRHLNFGLEIEVTIEKPLTFLLPMDVADCRKRERSGKVGGRRLCVFCLHLLVLLL